MKTEQLLEKLTEKFGVEFYEEFDCIVMEGYSFIMEWDEDENLFSIYKIFSYPVGTNTESCVGIMEEELSFIQNLYLESNQKPEEDYEVSMGCPYDDEKVGYFNCKFLDEEIFRMISYFSATEEKSNDLDFELLKEIVPEKVRDYFEEWKTENDKLYYLADVGWKVYKTRSIEGIGEVSRIFVNHMGTVLAGIDEQFFDEMVDKMHAKKRYKVSLYKGTDYAMAKTNKNFSAWNLNYIKDILSQIEKLELYDYDVEYEMTEMGLLIVRCGYYWAFVAPMKIELEKVVFQERNNLRKMLEALEEYMPEGLDEQGKIDFSCIKPEEFEELCKEILSELGFKNIFSRGNTNTPDGGVDIECDEEVEQIFGKKMRHWIFQCKHTKAQISRKDIAEVPCLLKEFKAEGYGLFYTGTFTTQTLDRLKGLRNEGEKEIQYWDNFELARIISKYVNVKKIYLDMMKSK